jgi:hypothetical protein
MNHDAPQQFGLTSAVIGQRGSNSEMIALLAILSVIVIFVIVFIDYYLMLRRTWRRREYGQVEQPVPPVPGLDASGELTIPAKYAIWNYMFYILGVGGVIIGIISGVAGYMIKDLAQQGATEKALAAMQEPLFKRLGELATAEAQLKAAAEKTANEASFAGVVATELATKHAAEVRGLPGAPGVSPSVADVATELATEHAAEVRGLPGAPGVSPSVADVATELAAKHANELRGPPGRNATGSRYYAGQRAR